MQYEERTVSMAPGDILVAYTDGIVEPENDYGEEFGTTIKSGKVPTRDTGAKSAAGSKVKCENSRACT